MPKYIVLVPIGGAVPWNPTTKVFRESYIVKNGTVGIVEAEDLGHLEHLLLSSVWGSSDWDKCVVAEIVKTEED